MFSVFTTVETIFFPNRCENQITKNYQTSE